MFKQQELASRIVDLSGWDDGKEEYNAVEIVQTLPDDDSEEDTSEEYKEMVDYKNSKV